LPRRNPTRDYALGRVAGNLGLDRLPERLIDDRLMFAKIGLLVVNDLTAIDAVLQPATEPIPTGIENDRYGGAP
jgi:hypothetical protein